MKRWLGIVLLILGILLFILQFGILDLVGIPAFHLTISGLLFIILGFGLLIKVDGKELLFFIVDLIFSSF